MQLYRGHDGTAQNLMVTCFSLGALLPAVEFLQNLGARTTAVWLSDMATSGGGGSSGVFTLRTLQVAYAMGVSRFLWVFGLIYVFVSLGMCLQAYLAFATRATSRLHAALGLLASLVGCITSSLCRVHPDVT